MKTLTYNLEDLPDILPIFPLEGVLLLPRGRLSLNIFEDRYINMIDDALRTERMIGMMQPKESVRDIQADNDNRTELFFTGCAGKITGFTETEDGHYLVTLTGVCRFDVEKELLPEKGYRRVKPQWALYEGDLKLTGHLGMDRNRLRGLLEDYFEQHELSCDWDMIDDVSDEKLVTCLSMVCPFSPSEKQALLEAGESFERARLFETILEMAVRGEAISPEAHH